MKFGSHVEVRLRSGEVLAADSEIWSTSANLGDEDVAQKFRDVAGRVLPRDRVETVIDRAFAIERGTSLEELVRAACL
jgi:hypothetical protein